MPPDAATHPSSNLALTPAPLSEAQPGRASPRPIVLVADDDDDIRTEVREYLARYGMEVLTASTIPETFEKLRHPGLAAVVLDQRFGDEDMLPLLPQIRAISNAAIIMHSGNQEETDRILSLEFGADDFVIKPASNRELLARLRANLRHPRPEIVPPAGVAAAPAPAPVAAPEPRAARPGGEHWHLSREWRRLMRADGRAVHLTTSEYNALLLFSENPGVALSRETLMRGVFFRGWSPGDRAVDNVVLHLRRKLQEETGEACLISVRHQGYVFTGFPPVETEKEGRPSPGGQV